MFTFYNTFLSSCLHVQGVIVWYLDLQLPMQSVPMSTEGFSLNPTYGEVYSIQHYKVSKSLSQGFGSPIKLTTMSDITDGEVYSIQHDKVSK